MSSNRRGIISLISLAAALGGLCPSAAADDAPPLEHSDVVFMYASNEAAYRAYGATFVAWGGANSKERVAMHHALGIRCTGSVWCLTAGAKTLFENEALREAVSVDIEGKPVAVPWQFDKVWKGQTTDFGNTNHPAFREHVKANVRRVMAGGADGLHVDDHLGLAHSVHWNGGGFDDRSIVLFRAYLRDHAEKAELEAAGVSDLDTFDYRDLVRKTAKTRDEVRRNTHRIPLFRLWKRFHLTAAADFVDELRAEAAKAAGHPVLLSANAGMHSETHHFVVPRLTHVVCEVRFDAHSGTESLDHARRAFASARRLRRPMACTASGHDWAWVKEHGVHEIVRAWIALTYAHGQRFMVPHPKQQWCFNKTLGTHWYKAPIAEFAPVYRFIRANAAAFDGFEADAEVNVSVGLDTGGGERLERTVRRRGTATVIHVVNLDYDAAKDRMRVKKGVRVELPAALVKGGGKVRHLRFDAEPADLDIRVDGDKASVTLPELRLWSVLEIR